MAGLMDLFGSSSPSYNVQPILNQINTSKIAQNGIVNQGATNLKALNQPYLDSTTALGNGLKADTAAAGNDYLNKTVNASDQLGTNLSQALMRQTMAAQPAINNSLSERLAATGGLARGGADQAFIQNAQQTNQNLFEGNQNLVNQQLQDRENALGNVYGNTTGAINTSYGNNVGANNNVFSNNVNATTGQTGGLLDTERGTTAQTLDALTAQQNANLAQSAGQNSANSALTGALLGAGGTIAGAYAGGPAVRGVTTSAQPAPANLSQSLLKNQYRPNSNLSLY